jgi:hypothetical protein
MLTLKTVNNWMIKLAGGLLAAGLAASLALLPAYAAAPSAASPDSGTPPGPLNTALSNIYQREQNWLSVQSNTLTDANTIAVNMQNWINTLKGQGKDTSPLEAALAAFNGQIASAQSAHDTASGVLSAHAGFDGSGQVTDRGQAVTTLRQAYQSLQQAHLTLVSAAVNLRLAVRTWINAHS